MAECLYCGSYVTAQYARVFAPDDLEEGKVRTCPNCTKVRDGPDVRQARSRGAAYQEGEIS